MDYFNKQELATLLSNVLAENNAPNNFMWHLMGKVGRKDAPIKIGKQYEVTDFFSGTLMFLLPKKIGRKSAQSNNTKFYKSDQIAIEVFAETYGGLISKNEPYFWKAMILAGAFNTNKVKPVFGNLMSNQAMGVISAVNLIFIENQQDEITQEIFISLLEKALPATFSHGDMNKSKMENLNCAVKSLASCKKLLDGDQTIMAFANLLRLLDDNQVIKDLIGVVVDNKKVKSLSLKSQIYTIKTRVDLLRRVNGDDNDFSASWLVRGAKSKKANKVVINRLGIIESLYADGVSPESINHVISTMDNTLMMGTRKDIAILFAGGKNVLPEITYHVGNRDITISPSENDELLMLTVKYIKVFLKHLTKTGGKFNWDTWIAKQGMLENRSIEAAAKNLAKVVYPQMSLL